MIIKRYYGGWHSTNINEGGTKSFIGWSRLEQHLKISGEVKENEIISQFELSADGITYTVMNEEEWKANG